MEKNHIDKTKYQKIFSLVNKKIEKINNQN